MTIYTIHPLPMALPPSHTIILLHGRHGDGEALREDLLVSERDSENYSLAEMFPSVKWVFPSSPDGYCSRQNITTQQWFDLWDLQEPWARGNLQFPGLTDSEGRLRRLIDREALLVNGYQNVILGGMSQGSALALAIFLSSSRKLGGFLGMCGWMPLLDCSKLGHAISKPHPNLRASPMFFTHSVGDEHVPLQNFRQMISLLNYIEMDVNAYEHMNVDRGDQGEDGDEMEGVQIPHWIVGPIAVDYMAYFLNARLGIARNPPRMTQSHL